MGIQVQKFPYVSDLATFRSSEVLTYGTVVFLQGTSAPNDGGQAFYQVSLTDKSTADNGGSCIVDLAGYRWFRSTLPPSSGGVLPVSEGGTGDTTLTNHGVMLGQGTSPVVVTAVGATGTVLKGVTGADPAFGAVVLTTDVSGTLPVANGGTGITSLGAGVATWLGTPSSANLAAAVTDETGSGALVFANTPSLATPAISGGTASSLTGLSIRSSGAAFDLTFATAEVLTAGRTLSWSLGDAARTITLSGNPTLNDWFDQSVKVAASPSFVTVTGSTSLIAASAANGVTITAAAVTRNNAAGSLTIAAGSNAGNTIAFTTASTPRLALTDAGASVTGVCTATGALTAQNATAIPAGGTAGAGVLVSSTANFGIFFGSGAPTLSAAKGSLYLRSDGSGATDRIYVNTNGSTTWTALTSVA